MDVRLMRGRNLGLAAFALITLLALIALPLGGSASTYMAGFRVSSEDTPLSGNSYVAGYDVTIRSGVDGDLTLAAMRANVDGAITGDVHAVAGISRIQGNIQGSLYVVGGLVRLDGAVRGDVVVAGGRIELNRGARISGDLVLTSAQAQVNGFVAGTVYGSTILYDQQGRIGNRLELQSDRIQIQKEATITGGIRYQSQTKASIADGATINGDIEQVNATLWKGAGAGALAPYGALLRVVWAMVTGVVLIAILPRVVYRVSDYARDVGSSIVFGIIGIVLLPLFAILTLASLLLLPIGVMLTFAIPGLLYLTQIAVAIGIGRLILPRKWRDGSRGYLMFALVIGMLIVSALRMAPVPYLGVAILILVTLWGLGAQLILLRDVNATRTRMVMHRRS